jgi:hypothetical protein
MKNTKSIFTRIVLVIIAAFVLSGAAAAVDQSPRISGFSFDPVDTDQCTPVGISMTISNPTDTTFYSQMPYSGTTYSIYQSFADKGMNPATGKYTVAASLNHGADGYPYRWGFQGELDPGQNTTITGYLSIPVISSVQIDAVLMNGDSVVSSESIATATITVNACAPQPLSNLLSSAQNNYYPEGAPIYEENPPLSNGESLMVPAEPMVQSFAGSLFFTGNGVMVSSGNTMITMFPGSQTGYVNGQQITLPIGQCYYENQLFLPPRYVCPLLGQSVYWDPLGGSIFMQSP